jgi:hypothetical protein
MFKFLFIIIIQINLRHCVQCMKGKEEFDEWYREQLLVYCVIITLTSCLPSICHSRDMLFATLIHFNPAFF